MTIPLNPTPGPGQQPIPTPESTAEIHKVDDVDTSSTAHHHTLGIQPNQASPGSHTHNGRDSKLLPTGTHTHTDGLMQSTQLISQDINAVRESGYYDCNNCSNVPDTNVPWWHVLNLNHNNNNGYIVQKAWALDRFDDSEWIRQCVAGTWNAWRKVGGMKILGGNRYVGTLNGNTAVAAGSFVAPPGGRVKLNFFSIVTNTFVRIDGVAKISFHSGTTDSTTLLNLTAGQTYNVDIFNGSSTMSSVSDASGGVSWWAEG